MKIKAVCCATACLVISAAINPSSAQSPPTLRAEHRIVVIDVVVTDNKGNPVHGLKASDFKVSEQNTPQKIEHLDEEDTSRPAPTPEAPPPSMPPGVYTNIVSTPPTGALNILLFDAANTPAESQMLLREQLKSFVKKLTPGSRIAIFGLGSQLYLLQGFTSDPAILQSALLGKKVIRPQGPKVQGGRDDRGATLSDAMDPLADADFFAVRSFERQIQVINQEQHAKTTLDGLNQLARYLSGMPGRKNLIWFSGGFPTYIVPDLVQPNSFETIPNNMGWAADVADEVQETIGLLARAQVAVYPVDPRAVAVDPVYTAGQPTVGIHRPDYYSNQSSLTAAQQAMEHLTMSHIAESTGGRAFFNTNDLIGAAEKAMESGANYYTISYTPSNNDWKGEYRKIKIETNLQGLHLAYRSGYYATKSGTHGKFEQIALEKTRTETTALSSALKRGAPGPTEIFFNLRITPGSPDEKTPAVLNVKKNQPWQHYILDYAVDPSTMLVDPDRSDLHVGEIEFICVIYDADGNIVNVAKKSAKLHLDPKQYRTALVGGLRLEQDVSAPSGAGYYFRIAIHDAMSNRVGAIEVPSAGIPPAPPHSSHPN
jgi:VWFA-related protein